MTTTAAAKNRAEALGDRQQAYVDEATAMVNGERAMLPHHLHVVALVIALEESVKDVATARERFADYEREREALMLELRVTRDKLNRTTDELRALQLLEESRRVINTKGE